MDVLIASRDLVAYRLLRTPPASYRTRILALGILWTIVFLQCLTFLYLWFKDRKQSGKSLKPFSIKKTPHGSLLSVQAIYVNVMIICIQSILATIRQGLLYSGYYKGGDRYYLEPLHTLVITGAVMAGFVFLFSNLNAAILLQSNRSRLQRLWIPVYNVCFVVLPLVWLGVTFNLGIRIGLAHKVLYDSAKEVLPLLESVIADPTSLTAATVMQLQSLEQKILSSISTSWSQRKVFFIMDFVYCSYLTLAAIAGIPLIIALRKRIRTIRTNHSMLVTTRAMPAPTVTSSQANILPSRTTVRALGNAPVSARTPHADPDGLQRLLRDLQVYVPLSTTLLLYFNTAVGLLWVNGMKDSWQWEEFSTDLLSWPWTTLQIIMLACFNYSLWKQRLSWKQSSSPDSAYGSFSSRSKNSIPQREREDMEVDNVHNVELQAVNFSSTQLSFDFQSNQEKAGWMKGEVENREACSVAA